MTQCLMKSKRMCIMIHMVVVSSCQKRRRNATSCHGRDFVPPVLSLSVHDRPSLVVSAEACRFQPNAFSRYFIHHPADSSRPERDSACFLPSLDMFHSHQALKHEMMKGGVRQATSPSTVAVAIKRGADGPRS